MHHYYYYSHYLRDVPGAPDTAEGANAYKVLNNLVIALPFLFFV
jgi:hypothetical protein